MAQIAVLGAGMVGVSTALALQDRGHDCVIVDRSPPGRETSYGNAGLIQAEAVEPYALPGNPLSLMRMAFGAKNAVELNWRSLPSAAPALFSYWRSSLPSILQKVIPIWQQLVSEAVPRHADLIAAAGADNLIRRDGYWEAHDTQSGLAAAILEAERRKQRYGVAFTLADPAALSRAEPGLHRPLAGAIHWTAPWSCLAPGELVASYARLFAKRGGRIVVGDAGALTSVGKGWHVAGESAEHVVVALGPWSPGLLTTFGYRVPMVRKRGYHRRYSGDSGLLRPMLLADHSVVLSPVLEGLQIATAAELSSAAPQIHPRQLVRGEAAARSLVEVGAPIAPAPWSGTRPCLPGMLPLVCQAPRHPGLWLNFGHGHQGFTLGPVTAERLARAMEGDANAIKGLDGGLR